MALFRMSALALLLACLTLAAPTTQSRPGPTPEQYSRLHWRTIGPEGNRFSSAAGIAGNPHIYYVGAASGGIWKTTDGGTNWAPIFDDYPVQSIGSLAVAPSETIGAMNGSLGQRNRRYRTVTPRFAGDSHPSQDLDPDVPIFRVRTMAQVAAAAVAQPRLYVLLISAFATTAILLAAVGLYGVLAFAVGQPSREIGIRIALGARHTQVVGLVMAQAGRLAATGTLAGLGLAAVASQALRSQLFEVTPTDATTYAAVTVTLLAVALLASWLPAPRSARVDPLSTIRHD